ncbi:MAG: hypothetical protein HY791_16255 [Deltaproteobacteria bacterium]|nr:hypothetical protein [Deltaproteobacteria bacterium]
MSRAGRRQTFVASPRAVLMKIQLETIHVLGIISLFLLAPASFSHAGPPPDDSRTLISLEDESGDDSGPGRYTHPTNPDFSKGSFDLKRLVISVEGGDAVFSVTLAAPIRRPHEARRTDARPLPLENGVYVQNVDIYVDTQPSAGLSVSIPGRRVRFRADEAWDFAVLLTPLPFEARSILSDALPEAAGRVVVPANVAAKGATLVTRVPLSALGAAPSSEWGVQVLVTGALWSQSLAAVDRLIGRHEPNVLAMPVTTLPETFAFGGGELGRAHPWVIDLFDPPGTTQAALLSSYGANDFATVPMHYSHERLCTRDGSCVPTSSAAVATGVVEAKVASMTDGKIVVTPALGLNVWDFADVLDAAGQPVARVVVNRVFSDFVLATVVEGADRVVLGARVRALARDSRGTKP